MGWSILYWLTVISILFALCVLIRSEYERGCLEVTKYEIVFDTLPKALTAIKLSCFQIFIIKLLVREIGG